MKRIATVENISLKKGHWAVFITIDGKDYLLGQVIVTVDGKINNYISEWKGEKLKSAISQLYELNDLLLIGNGYCLLFMQLYVYFLIPKLMQFEF